MEPTNSRRRARTLLPLGAVFALTLTAIAPGVTARPGDRRIDIDAFMTGLACIESSGRFTAVNKRSGALGKYQIMPRNWRAWSGRYLGNRWARPTPRNQEYVARQRILALYELRGDWRRVAYWWLTGDGEPDERLWTRPAARCRAGA
jgi:hypothetical protein